MEQDTRTDVIHEQKFQGPAAWLPNMYGEGFQPPLFHRDPNDRVGPFGYVFSENVPLPDSRLDLRKEMDDTSVLG